METLTLEQFNEIKTGARKSIKNDCKKKLQELKADPKNKGQVKTLTAKELHDESDKIHYATFLNLKRDKEIGLPMKVMEKHKDPHYVSKIAVHFV